MICRLWNGKWVHTMHSFSKTHQQALASAVEGRQQCLLQGIVLSLWQMCQFLFLRWFQVQL